MQGRRDRRKGGMVRGRRAGGKVGSEKEGRLVCPSRKRGIERILIFSDVHTYVCNTMYRFYIHSCEDLLLPSFY